MKSKLKIMKFIAKKTIEAEQFLPPHKIPKGVFNVYELSDGVFSGQIWHQGEVINIKPGDWIVENPDSPDKYSAINNDVFLAKYEPASLSLIKQFNTTEKRIVTVHSGEKIFEGEVTELVWDVDQWAFKINGFLYCQSEIR